MGRCQLHRLPRPTALGFCRSDDDGKLDQLVLEDAKGNCGRIVRIGVVRSTLAEVVNGLSFLRQARKGFKTPPIDSGIEIVIEIVSSGKQGATKQVTYRFSIRRT